MLSRGIAILLLFVTSFAVATPVIAAATRRRARCCLTKACPMMTHRSSATSWASCDSDAFAAMPAVPAVMPNAIAFVVASSNAQQFIVAIDSPRVETSDAIEHPPRTFRV